MPRPYVALENVITHQLKHKEPVCRSLTEFIIQHFVSKAWCVWTVSCPVGDVSLIFARTTLLLIVTDQIDQTSVSNQISSCRASVCDRVCRLCEDASRPRSTIRSALDARSGRNLTAGGVHKDEDEHGTTEDGHVIHGDYCWRWIDGRQWLRAVQLTLRAYVSQAPNWLIDCLPD